MGRQATAHCRWKAQSAPVKALLEATEIILRGDIRARIPRPAISAITAGHGTLALNVDGEALHLDFGDGEAEKWAEILRKPPPSLVQKLGLTQGAKAFVIGAITDHVLAAALEGLVAPAQSRAAYLIGEVHRLSDLARACAKAKASPSTPLWIIHQKGQAASVKDSDIRATMRAQAFIDVKSTAVSPKMTATLYRARLVT